MLPMPVSILSVSYDRALLMTRQLMLEAQGYNVVSALGFKDAERQCQEGRFDLLVMGHSIPVTDKQALIAMFRKTSGTSVVSILRAGEGLVDGADHHVWPDDPRALVQEIAAITPPARNRNVGA
jgi:DNA-binding response OmpR family regulator